MSISRVYIYIIYMYYIYTYIYILPRYTCPNMAMSSWPIMDASTMALRHPIKMSAMIWGLPPMKSWVLGGSKYVYINISGWLIYG